MKVSFDPLAAKEFADSVAFYEAEMLGLGTKFKNEIIWAIRNIKQFVMPQ